MNLAKDTRFLLSFLLALQVHLDITLQIFDDGLHLVDRFVTCINFIDGIGAQELSVRVLDIDIEMFTVILLVMNVRGAGHRHQERWVASHAMIRRFWVLDRLVKCNRRRLLMLVLFILLILLVLLVLVLLFLLFVIAGVRLGALIVVIRRVFSAAVVGG